MKLKLKLINSLLLSSIRFGKLTYDHVCLSCFIIRSHALKYIGKTNMLTKYLFIGFAQRSHAENLSKFSRKYVQ